MKKSLSLGIALILVVAFAASAGSIWYVRAEFFAPLGLESRAVIHIPSGTSPRGIESRLVERNVIGNRLAFRLYLRLTGISRSLKSGWYEFDPGVTLAGVLGKIASGDSLPEDRPLTIPEGFSVADIRDRAVAAGLFSPADLQNAFVMQEAYRDLWLVSDLAQGASLEGYLFPDTYRVLPRSDPRELVHRMVDAMQNVLIRAGFGESSAPDGWSDTRSFLTFASIVQKESPRDDMPLIAGVFRNRLDAGWRLESDATVNYLLGTSKLVPSGADVRVDDPYNTYLHTGLPPGPIANPGRSAIEATLHPQVHDYFFFLHSPSGRTLATRTYEEHLKQRGRYWN